MLPPCVLWIDPGKMTGLAWLWQVNAGTSFWADEFAFQEAGQHIADTCARFGPTLAVGWETYRVDRSLPQTNARDAIEPIGVARWHAQKYGCRILPEGQRHTPTPADRQLLTRIGWWVPGKNDAQSAAWHMHNWCVRTGNLPPPVAAAALSDPAGTLQGRHRERR
jgi:hypothetical protein